jgi:methylated-DNA-[protein]-cysteine S-methyltransferase
LRFFYAPMTYHAILAAPFGQLGLSTDADALLAVHFLTEPQPLLEPPAGSLAAEAVRQLNAYFADPTFRFDLPLRPIGTSFQLQVWREIAAIPCGETRSYGELAERTGSVARAVGGACGRNPLPIVIPCHRVLAQRGLGGFNRSVESPTVSIKHWLLVHEGALLL